MKKLVLLATLLSTQVYASVINVSADCKDYTGRTSKTLGFESQHSYVITNNTGHKQIYNIFTYLCQQYHCESFKDTRTLENGASYNLTHALYLSQSFDAPGFYPLTASTLIKGDIEMKAEHTATITILQH